jgi:LmbE family N-acetylglucosaminyl deacetylase
MNKVIIISPHPDDEVLGCGATIARHVYEGDEVMVVIATNASIGAPELYTRHDVATVRKEAKKAHKLLGVNDTVFMDFPAPALNSYPIYKISLALLEVFKEFKPSVLYLPHPGDLHQDHDIIYRSALVAARPQGEHRIGSIYCYETLSETEWTPIQDNNPFVPDHFVEVTDFFEKKIEAFRCYNSQIRIFPHSRSIEGLIALATFRGATVGVKRAEAFEVERQII